MRTPETTLYVIAYDIGDDKRRTRIFKLLCGYGAWTQYSLFECWLTKQHLLELRAKLQQHLQAGDSVRMYPLCKSCVARVETEGSPRPVEQQTTIL
jgi:CRISPR-associated protein Cas2